MRPVFGLNSSECLAPAPIIFLFIQSWNQFAIHYLELRKYIRLESRIDSSTSQQTIRLRHSVRQQEIRLLQTTLTVRISPGDMVQLSHFLPNTPLPLPLQQTSFPTFAHPVCTLLLLLTLQLPPVPVQLLPSSARLTGSFWLSALTLSTTPTTNIR